MLDKKDILHPRAKEKPQQDSSRGTMVFKIKSQTHEGCSEGANKTLHTPGLRERSSDPPQETELDCI